MKRSLPVFIVVFSFIITACTQFLFSQNNDEETIYLSRIEQGMRHCREQALQYHATDPDSAMAIALTPYVLLSDEKVDSFKPLFLEIYRKEKELSEDYYQVITAQNAQFLCYQIILKELNQIIENEIFSTYEFFRDIKERKYQNLTDFFSAHPNILLYEQLIEKQADIKMYEILADDLQEMSDKLISASFTLETCAPVESAQYVFITGAGMGGIKEKKGYLQSIIAEIFERRGIASSIYQPYVEQWLEIMPKSTEGTIYQIFISKQFANEILYISLPQGMQLPESKELDIFFYHFKDSQLNNTIDIFHWAQARVLVDALNPSNSMVFRYNTIDQKEIEQYTLFIRQGIQEILKVF